MWTQKLTKIEIAKRQLLHANELFCAEKNIVSAITLAGAADEVLGKLVERNGAINALDQEVKDQCEMFESFFGHTADPKIFRELENYARNHLKHIGSEETVELDLEQRAVDLIERAVKNYQKLYPGPMPEFTKFDDKAAAW
jgi:hypothetical protein